MGCIHSAPKHGGRGGGLGGRGRPGGPPRASDVEIRDRIECSPAAVTTTVGSTTLRYAYLSQRGYYPDALNKANQDCFLVCRNFMRDPNRALFSVFDGHGREGDLCAQFARDLLVEKLGEHLRGKETERDIRQGITHGFLELNDMMHQNPGIDDTLSGTTAITILFLGDTMYVANVGDSRAIVAQRADPAEEGQLEGQGQGNGGGGNGAAAAAAANGGADGGQGQGQGVVLKALALSDDQTPYRKDERERVKKCGARVLSMDQISGMEPIHEDWGDVKLGEDIDEAGDPPRIWSKYGEYPGTAFTRSLGDSIAEELGVYAVPEITVRKVSPRDAFVVIASDGVFEFLTNQNVVEMIRQHPDPLEACHAVVQEAYDLWLQYEVRTDDITIIVIYIDATAGVKTAAATAAAAAAAAGPPTTPKSPSGRVTGPRPSPRSPRGGILPISSLDVSATVATPTSISRAREAAAAAAAVAGGGGGGEEGGASRGE